jgi:hypothetical protein
VSAALQEMQELEANRERQRKKKKKGLSSSLRASTTDPEARVMKMADGGYRPAYNGQLSVDVASQIVLGVDLSNSGSDRNQLVPMLDQLRDRYQRQPAQVLVDGGYSGLREVTEASKLGTLVFAPLPPRRDPNRDPHAPRRGDSPAVALWRRRMGEPEAKEIYKQRGASVECVNAMARQRGLHQFRVRGKHKARAVLLWYAVAHNLMRSLSLLRQPILAS